MRSAKQLKALVAPKPKRVTWKRTPEEDARIYGPEDFRAWLHQQPCAVCGWIGKPEQMQQCHARTGGTGYKAHWTKTFPGCGPHMVAVGEWKAEMEFRPLALIDGCHAESGRGVKTFEKARGVKLLDLAAKTQAAWLAFKGAK